MKCVAGFFGDEIAEGDVIYHNDPAYMGSHILDCCMYKPVFYKGELVFWTVCKGHLTDIGGPVPAGYNPDAKEIYAEGLRIPPVKLWAQGQRREDVINLLLTNMRARAYQEGDLNAQYGACSVGERHLIELLDRYGVDQVRACITELKDMADRHMRALLRDVPDGFYSGTAILEDSGHGLGELSITAQVEIRGDEAHVLIESPPQVPYFINSYAGNSISGVYLGLMMFAQVPPPYNEGLYRCVSVDVGPSGTLCNAQEPAPHVNCTTTPMETLADAVRLALEQAAPERVTASWGHASGINIAGHDPRNNNDEYVTMVLGSVISGAGANKAMDGWPACGPLCCFGSLMSGDIELLEYSYPVLIHRYSLMTDSGGAGEFRGGSGTRLELEPLKHAMTVVGFGEGRQLPTAGAAGAKNVLLEPKLGRLIHRHVDGEEDHYIQNTLLTAQPGERVINVNPGGGGYGDPLRRPLATVLADVRNGLVSIDGARLEYGVVIDGNGQLDEAATHAHRAAH